MRILLLIDNLGSGGAQRQIVMLAKGLKNKGYDVKVLLYHDSCFFCPEVEAYGVKVEKYLKTDKIGFKVVRRIRQLIVNEKYRKVISFLDTPNLYALLGHVLSKQNAHLIVSERSFDSVGKQPFKKKLIRFLYRYANAIVCNSIHQAENIRHLYPRFYKKIYTIYNGVDFETFSLRNQSTLALGGQFKILSIGSVSSNKNIRGLVEAIRIIRDKGIDDIQVTWVGEQVMSIQSRAIYIQQMKYLVAHYELETCWTWLPADKDVVNFYNDCDILVHPSFGEGLPNVVCEAASCGVPIILSKVCDHPYLVKHGETGFLFDVNDSQDLADKIMHFRALSRSERLEMGYKAHVGAKKMFDVAKMVDEYEKILQNVD